MDLISRERAINTSLEFFVEFLGGALHENAQKELVARFQRLPSAEPVRCKDCKYWHREIHNGIEYFNFSSCDLNHYGDGHNFYCADAEKRTDG